jgi:hypothetical protein
LKWRLRMHALGLPEKIGASTYKENKEDNSKILLRIQGVDLRRLDKYKNSLHT